MNIDSKSNHEFVCVCVSNGPNSYFQYLRMRISMRIFYYNICECELEYYTLIFANANNVFMLENCLLIYVLIGKVIIV